MDMDKELEEVMAANSEWKGEPDKMWQRVAGEIHSRRERRKWQIPALGAAVAAALLVAFVGSKVLLPGALPNTDPPPVATGEQGEQPPVYAPPSSQSGGRWSTGFRLYDTLPGLLYYSKTVLVGEVIAEKVTEIPPTEDQWQTYRASQTPPPPDHPKAQGWRPAEPPKPTPARLFTVKVTEGIKGIATGQTVTVRQLNVTYANAGPEPLLQVGKRYLLIPNPTDEGTYEVGAPYLEIGADNRLRLVALSFHRDWATDGGGDTVLRELDGAEVEQGLHKLRFAVRAETAIAAALTKVGISGEVWDPVVPSGVPFDLGAFPRYIGVRGGCIAGRELTAIYETSVWPKAGGGSEVRMIRRVTSAGQDHETMWTFQVKPDGSVDGPVRSGSSLEVSKCE